MARSYPRSRLVWATILVSLGASASLAALSGVGGGRATPAGAGVEIVAPESEAQIRGVAAVKAEWPAGDGYVLFRVDGDFLYATTAPYGARWDTSSTADGEHVVEATAYDRDGSFAGSSSIRVSVKNALPTPENGVLVEVRFREQDSLTRAVTARGELSALQANQVLPEGFGVLAGELRGEVTQTVVDAYYEGVSALVRNRLREASLTAGGSRQSVPEMGDYAMVQVSRNGLAIPTSVGGRRDRVGLGEISLGLADYPLLPGDTWDSPAGVVCDLYTRRAVYVQATHEFEGLRWFRGRECALITSTYSVPEVPLLRAPQAVASAGAPGATGYEVALTQAMGRRGMMGGQGMMGRQGMMGQRAGQAAPGRAATGPAGVPARAAPGGPAPAVQSARLVNLQGQRRTYVTVETGRVMYTRDVITGKVEFRAASGGAASSVAAARPEGYRVELAQMAGRGMAGRGMMGGQGMMGRQGMMGGQGTMGRQGMMGRQGTTGQRAGQAAPGRAVTGPAATELPSSLDYALRLTTELVAP